MQAFKVQGMTCGHCVRAVTQALVALDTQAKVEVDLPNGQVTVDSQLTAEQVLAAIRDEGYEVEPA